MKDITPIIVSVEDGLTREDKEALKELSISPETWEGWTVGPVTLDHPSCGPVQQADNTRSKRDRSISLIAGGFAAVNLVALISLYPVLRGRGAPYLPTKRRNLDQMFQELKDNQDFRRLARDSNHKLKFVDLGSGDGRVVFRAARENIFAVATGFEINPTLHGCAQVRRLLTPKYWATTRFALGDIWKADLTDVDVVAVVRT
jgi:hypothetical protein